MLGSRMAITRISIKDEDELRKIVASDISIIEEGLAVICDSMPIDTKTKIDILCNDDNGQLVILKLSAKEKDDIFFEGLKILAYINNVKPILKFSYKDFRIDENKTPRLIFLAPAFSPQLVDVIGQMRGIQMDLYTLEYFEFDDKKALHLEPVWLSEDTKSKPKRKKPDKPKPLKLAETKKEPEPEPVTKEIIMQPEEIKPGTPRKESKDKKKSIFSI